MALTQPCEAMKVAQFYLQLWEIKALPTHFLPNKESWQLFWPLKMRLYVPFASEIAILFQNQKDPHSKVRRSPFASTMRGGGRWVSILFSQSFSPQRSWFDQISSLKENPSILHWISGNTYFSPSLNLLMSGAQSQQLSKLVPPRIMLSA